MKSYRVYLLRNSNQKSYIGLSEDVHRRLIQHNNGESRWTAKHRPWELEWFSAEMSLGEARRLENLLKHQKGGEGLASLLKEYRGS